MQNIRSISDLKNYNDILNEVAEGSPVYLTTNEEIKYVILDIKEYEKLTATIKLINELDKSRQSAEENGWCTIDDLKAELGL